MSSRVIKKLLGVSLASVAMLALLIITSSKATAANFQCSKSDAAYAVTINVDPSAPAWVRGCFQRITVNEGFTGAISFMYFSPETYDLSGGDRSATLKILYYYRGTAGVNFAGMCPKITSTSNSDGQTNVMSIPDAGFGFSLTCSGWLGHNSWSSASGSTTLYASKFNAGSNKTINMNYDVAFTFTNDTSNPGGTGITCKDYYGKPGESGWKSPPCINNGSSYAFVNIIKSPPTYDGTISVAKYTEGATLGQFPVSPSVINNATVGLDHSPPDSWSTTKTSNPGAFNNIWVNPSNHESNTKGNYRAFVNVPIGWKVVRATNRGSNATLNGTCTSGGKCSVHGVTVDNNGTTYVDFFFEPDISGNLDGVCTSPNETTGPQQPASQNGKIWGWVRDTYNGGASSKIDVYIDGGPSNAAWGARIDANRPREAAVGGNYGFEVDIPSKFFDGNEHSLRIYVLRNGGGFDGGVGNNPYQLKIIKTSYNGIISVDNPNIGKFSCPPPVGRVTCLKEDNNNFLQGWTFDPYKPEGPSNVHVYFDSTPGNTSDPDAVYNRGDVFGTIKLTPAEITARKNEGYRGVDENGLYRFKVPIPDGLHDGENHEVRIYMITSGDNTPNPGLEFVNLNSTVLNFGPSNPNCGTVEKWWWPWLQTQNGDVINNGKITGQKIASSSGELPGARLSGGQGATNASKEAEFLVISMAGGGNPFCSNYNYILTNTAATTGDCKNGDGYGTLQLYDLGSGADDKIFKSISDSFASNGAGNPPANAQCKPYNTEKSVPPAINTGAGAKLCEGGTIYQLQSGDDLGAKTLLSGRNTIYKDGNLKITGNIVIDESGVFSSSNPRLHPNLAIIVKGDVYIDRAVTRIDSAIYATGKIYTCSSGSPTPFDQCRDQLLVNGMLVSRNGYDFRRTFASDGRQPAELVRLKGQNVAFPPPGLDNLYFEDFNNDVRIDTSEFQPKF